VRLDLSRLPHDVTRAERAALFAALLIAHENEHGLMWTTYPDLQAALDITKHEHLRSAVSKLEDRRYLRRVDPRIYVIKSPFFGGGCCVCGDPKVHLTSHHCGVHFQTDARKDRSWKRIAIDTWERGVVAGRGNMNIANSVHVKTGQPLWGHSEDGAPGTGSGSGEGIIPFYVSQGLMPDSMLRLAKRARTGGGAIDD
jgi:hypothetical protein